MEKPATPLPAEQIAASACDAVLDDFVRRTAMDIEKKALELVKKEPSQ